MYKILTIFSILFLLLGCSDEDSAVDQEIVIDISPDELTLSSESSSQTITVTSSASWAVSSSADWCTVSPTEGYSGKTNVTVTTTANEGLEDRSATIKFSSVTYIKEISLVQSFLIQEVNITDEAFKTYTLEHLDTNEDDIFSLDEAAKIKTLDISGLNIKNLTGIESFSTLETLDCSNNQIDEMDLSELGALTSLNCSSNQLSEINIRQNINLLNLDCTDNQTLSSIYVWTGFSPGANFLKPESAVYVQPVISTPLGYSLVWQEEFNDALTQDGRAAIPNTDMWWYETGDNGWGNNEIQNYIAAVKGADTCATIYDGSLKIIAKKSGSEVLSIRMNTIESWTYGYFEARLKLPVGKGTWPAFWMMPKNFTSWPGDGEIDIMEEVGANPNHVSSSIHCTAYNHSLGTQKTAEKYIPTAESEFHVYAVEWTEDYIKGLIDGEVYFTFNNDHTNNKDTWPFNEPFYLKLNLAWGGDWGGYLGVDESALPTTYEIDYVRVFQKN
ncbi:MULTISPECIES: family 16 glycosylhydrolase [unclassified Saccharicrinis]|uniref:family 16 glycosylhydrolase n=1 Tax=unclassified Saccharicrinis TaxID=2646859 RepID=UPI003D33551B